jgi:hypothetical protein
MPVCVDSLMPSSRAHSSKTKPYPGLAARRTLLQGLDPPDLDGARRRYTRDRPAVSSPFPRCSSHSVAPIEILGLRDHPHGIVVRERFAKCDGRGWESGPTATYDGQLACRSVWRCAGPVAAVAIAPLLIGSAAQVELSAAGRVARARLTASVPVSRSIDDGHGKFGEQPAWRVGDRSSQVIACLGAEKPYRGAAERSRDDTRRGSRLGSDWRTKVEVDASSNVTEIQHASSHRTTPGSARRSDSTHPGALTCATAAYPICCQGLPPHT